VREKEREGEREKERGGRSSFDGGGATAADDASLRFTSLPTVTRGSSDAPRQRAGDTNAVSARRRREGMMMFAAAAAAGAAAMPW